MVAACGDAPWTTLIACHRGCCTLLATRQARALAFIDDTGKRRHIPNPLHLVDQKQVGQFERDLRSLLHEVSPQGVFAERLPDTMIWIWHKPGP
jgi:hypothetical protein